MKMRVPYAVHHVARARRKAIAAIVSVTVWVRLFINQSVRFFLTAVDPYPDIVVQKIAGRG